MFYAEYMIAFLDGVIQLKTEKFVIITIQGVGYKVFAGIDAMAKIPEQGRGVKLWTHQHVREDSLELYGFLYFAELEFFEMLIGISGIGPKGALGVMGVAPVDTVKKAIASGDTSYLTRVSGIGRKTAEKIVLELREKMSGLGARADTGTELKDEADALDALVSLGYSQREARDALVGEEARDGNVEARVKAALKELGKKSQ